MVERERLRLPVAVSPYRKKLVQEVHRKLRRAVDAPSQRSEILHQLFTDLALQVDARALARLYGIEEGAAAAGDGIVGGRDREWPLCFYEALAEHYAQVPEDAKGILPLFMKLWSQSLAAQIFTLLFYEWLFEGATEEIDNFVRYATAFIEGASIVFWIDLESNSKLFFALFQYMLKDVFMNPQRSSKVKAMDHQQLVSMFSKFFFLYEPAANLHDFLAHFPPSYTTMNLEAADIFVIELTDQLQKVKVEPVLLQYLESAKCLKGEQLRVPTSTRLRTALYGFTSPGGPMYPTRAVRHAAWETLDCLFPVGRMLRHLISLFFRLMHPYYWPGSFVNFVMAWVWSIRDRIHAWVWSIVDRILLILLRISNLFLGRREVPP